MEQVMANCPPSRSVIRLLKHFCRNWSSRTTKKRQEPLFQQINGYDDNSSLNYQLSSSQVRK